MTVSAIITTFNRASILPRAIESVLAQTRPVDEVLVVDDGSSDNTREVVSRYPLARYIYQQNRGLSAARNTGVREARGVWVAFLDDDDQWLPKKTELQLEALRAAPDAALCYGGPFWVGKDGVTGRVPVANPEKLWPGIRLKSPICPCTVMIRKDVFTQLGGFNEKLRCVEDWEFAIRLVRGNKCTAVNTSPLVRVYEDPNSMSKNSETMLAAELSILDTLLVGLQGPSRFLWKHRILSRIYYRAAVSARERRQSCWKHLLRSLLHWPSPDFMAYRYGTFLLELIKAVQPQVLTALPSRKSDRFFDAQ